MIGLDLQDPYIPDEIPLMNNPVIEHGYAAVTVFVPSDCTQVEIRQIICNQQRFSYRV